MTPTLHGIDGRQYAIYESPNNARSVLFLHGNSLSSETFASQFVPELEKEFHLVAFDFLGHGASGNSPSPSEDYSIQGMVSQVQAVVEHLELNKPIVIANSLGGHIALHYASEVGDIGGIGIFGTPPLRTVADMATAFLPTLDVGLLFKPELTSEEALVLAKVFIQVERQEILVQQILRTDPAFKTSLYQDISNWSEEDEAEIVKKSGIPILVAHGEKELGVSLEYIQQIDFPTLFERKIQVIENAFHCTQLSQPKEFNKLLLRFFKSLA
ncbi:alpha/beta hydrolase [Flammeovirgaceae bacterium SG7u.111]|nr:alpha/beta hydrolase [Flammeovirgaceae bacterium SG7u.132]WPO35265.1 alpha/beta hydrolase [Flammeovirgaceae bacterium SG7u.111]